MYTNFCGQGCTQDVQSSKDNANGSNSPANVEDGNVEDKNLDDQVGQDEINEEDIDEEGNEEDEEVASPQNLVYISADRLNVRSQPDSTAER